MTADERIPPRDDQTTRTALGHFAITSVQPQVATIGGASTGPGARGAAPRAGVLEVIRGPHTGGRFLLADDITTAGRHPDSDIFLDDITVSRRHVEIRWSDGEYSIVDVGSLNGSYVNRVLIKSALLRPGDEIQIGKFRLAFTCSPSDDKHLGASPPPRDRGHGSVSGTGTLSEAR